MSEIPYHTPSVNLSPARSDILQHTYKEQRETKHWVYNHMWSRDLPSPLLPPYLKWKWGKPPAPRAFYPPPPLQSPPFCQAGPPPPGGGGHEVTVPPLGGGGGDCTTKLYHSITV